MKEMLCGDMKSHVGLQCSDIKEYGDLMAIIMKWATAKRVEKEKRNAEVGTVEKPNGSDQTSNGAGGRQDWSWISAIGWDQSAMGGIDCGAKRRYQGKGP